MSIFRVFLGFPPAQGILSRRSRLQAPYAALTLIPSMATISTDVIQKAENLQFICQDAFDHLDHSISSWNKDAGPAWISHFGKCEIDIAFGTTTPKCRSI